MTGIFPPDELSLCAALIKVVRRRAVRRRCYLKHQEDNKAKALARVARNREQHLARRRAIRAANRDFLLPIRRAEYAGNKEHINELRRIWFEENRDRVNKIHRESIQKRRRDDPKFAKRQRELQRIKNALHPEKNRERMSKWAKANPEKMNTQKRKRKAHKLGQNVHYTAMEWQTLKRQLGFRCVGCWKTETELKVLGRKLVGDHIIALSAGGMDDITNIQPLCHGTGGCNNSKGKKYQDFLIS